MGQPGFLTMRPPGFKNNGTSWYESYHLVCHTIGQAGFENNGISWYESYRLVGHTIEPPDSLTMSSTGFENNRTTLLSVQKIQLVSHTKKAAGFCFLTKDPAGLRTSWYESYHLVSEQKNQLVSYTIEPSGLWRLPAGSHVTAYYEDVDFCYPSLYFETFRDHPTHRPISFSVIRNSKPSTSIGQFCTFMWISYFLFYATIISPSSFLQAWDWHYQTANNCGVTNCNSYSIYVFHYRLEINV